MEKGPTGMQRLLGRLMVWAESRPDVRAAILVGSWARQDRPADEWSDLDVILVADEPERYLSEAGWLQEIGTPWITFLERTPSGEDTERRVLFEGGLDVDFVPVDRERVREALRQHPLPETLQRGMRVLLDKDGVLSQWEPAPVRLPPPAPPTGTAFRETANDFWYHAVWTAKKLRRGELWVAKSCCDGYMKQLVLRMIEWHARATREGDHDTWFGGRFLEQWADRSVREGLAKAFAHYDEEDIPRALHGTMRLFRRLARETAAQLGFAYPASADERASEFVQTLFPESIIVPRALIVGLVFLEREDAILLVKQDFGRRYWSLPGGMKEPGESVEETAIREVKEETNLDIRLKRLVGLYSKRGEDALAVCFEGEVVGGTLRAAHEISECRYFPHDRLPEPVREHLPLRIQDFLSRRPQAFVRTQ